MLIRMKYTKTKAGRFLSHLDLMRAWERVIRRAGLPLSFSQGFNPHPKISFGSALAVGTTSAGEYMDMELTAELAPDAIIARLRATLPPALTVETIREIPAKSAALMSIINRAEYELILEMTDTITQEQLDLAIAAFLAQKEVEIMRYKKNSKEKRVVDIQQGVFDLQGQVLDQKLVSLRIMVQTGSEGNVRPEEVVYGLLAGSLPLVQEIQRIHRNGLYIATAQGLITPLDIPTALS